MHFFHYAYQLYCQKGALKLVDVPGHERVRQRFFDNYKNTARGIVFVLDSFNLNKDVRDVAEYACNAMAYRIYNKTTLY